MSKKTISVDLTEEQLKKVEILNENGIDVGEAIDMLFEVREGLKTQNEQYLQEKLQAAQKEKEELEDKLNKVNKEIDVIDKLVDNTLDLDKKQEILEKEYAIIDKTYDAEVQDRKRKIKWEKDFFRF